MKKMIFCAPLLLVAAVLAGCGKGSDAVTTSDASTANYGDYGLGSTKLGYIIGEGFTANQDVPTYSNGKVSVSIDSDKRITKMNAYFNIADMEKDYVVCFDGATYSSIDAIVEKFGDFDDKNIIEYSDDKAKLHVEITNKSKGEYYISVKAL